MLVRRSLSLATCAPYDFFKSITVDRSMIPGTCGATLASYPLLFSVTDDELKVTTSGGKAWDSPGDCSASG